MGKWWWDKRDINFLFGTRHKTGAVTWLGLYTTDTRAERAAKRRKEEAELRAYAASLKKATAKKTAPTKTAPAAPVGTAWQAGTDEADQIPKRAPRKATAAKRTAPTVECGKPTIEGGPCRRPIAKRGDPCGADHATALKAIRGQAKRAAPRPGRGRS